MFRRLISAIALLGVSLSLVGCSGITAKVDNTPASSASAVTTTSTTLPPEPVGDLNPLTGEYNITPGADTRPIALMIGNNKKSRPQYGIDQADLFVEGETEGGITRIMTVFSGIDRMPEQLGPNRSARSPFITFAAAMDAIYCHAGGSKVGLKTLKTGILDNVNALYYDGTTYWRDKQLWNEKGMEYSMMTSGELMAKRVKKLKYSTTTDRAAPYCFGTPNGTADAERVQVHFSGAQTISFVYDPAARVYEKFNGTLEDGEKHITAEGNTVKATNILVMYAKRYAENEETYNFELTSGHGCAVSCGKSRPVNWKITKKGWQFTEQDGSPAIVAPGKTYICFVNSSLESKTLLLP